MKKKEERLLIPKNKTTIVGALLPTGPDVTHPPLCIIEKKKGGLKFHRA